MFSNDGIGHAAHLGGLVIGYLIARKIMQDTYTAFQEYKPMV
jgi:membrane associated rhomboid family serine protease